MFKKLPNLARVVKQIEVLLGVTILIKGIWLATERQYFFFPPQISPALNTPYLDGFMMIVGLLLIGFSLQKKRTKFTVNTIRTLLVISAVIWLFLALIQATHGIFTPEYRMGHPALGDFFIFCIITIIIGYV